MHDVFISCSSSHSAGNEVNDEVKRQNLIGPLLIIPRTDRLTKLEKEAFIFIVSCEQQQQQKKQKTAVLSKQTALVCVVK